MDGGLNNEDDSGPLESSHVVVRDVNHEDVRKQARRLKSAHCEKKQIWKKERLE